MSYPRNAASPPHFLVGYVYDSTTNALQTSGVSARVKTGTGSWGAAAGTLDCDTTSGAWTYTPTQAETNAEAFSVSLYKASCSGVGMTVITSKSASSGYAGLDWGQLIGASTSVNLAGTTVMKVNDAVTLPSSASINITGNITGNLSGSVGSVTGAVGSVTGNVGGSVASVTGAVGSVTGNVGGNVTGSVGSVVAGVTVSTNNDKTGYSLTQEFPANFSSLAITAGGAVTAGTVSDKTGYSLSSSQTFSTTGSVGSVTGAVGSVTTGVTVSTNNDKTGYSLTQSFPSNFSSLAITAGGAVTVATNNDKTGYSLTQAFPSNFASLSISAGGVVSANATQWNGGTLPTIGTSTLTAQQVWEYATRTLSAFGFSVTVGTNNDKTGYSLTQAFPSNFSSLGINASGHISRVTLVDTTTTNSDMRGTDGAALATHWTSTRAGYLDSVLIAANSNRTVQVTGSNHVAADIHELQAGVITAADFATGAIDAAALATSAAQEIADMVLSRALTTAEATAGRISLCTLVLALTSKAFVTSGVLNVYRTDGTTLHAQIPVASDANAEPIVGIG